MEYYHTTENYGKIIENVLRHSITGLSIEDAEDLFIYAKNSMLSVNSWKQHSKIDSASFELTDNTGYVLHRHARTGDNIRITLQNGAVYELHIDAIVYDDYPDAGTESISMYLNPVSKMESNNESVFCTLAIERSGIHLHAVCTGAEEVPGLSSAQLQDLILGFIDFEEN